MRANPERHLSRNEVEAIWGISRRWLEIAAIRGDGPPFVKIGRSVRYRYSDVEDWLEARKVRSTSSILGE